MMRLLLLLPLVSLVALGCQTESDQEPPGDGGGTAAAATTLEVACAKCVYKKEGLAACTAACKIDDDVVLLEGEGVDTQKLMTDHGFCTAPIQAEVEGQRVGDKFVATSFKVKE